MQWKTVNFNLKCGGGGAKSSHIINLVYICESHIREFADEKFAYNLYLKIMFMSDFHLQGIRRRWLDLTRYFCISNLLSLCYAGSKTILCSWNILHLTSARIRVSKGWKTLTGLENYNLKLWTEENSIKVHFK